MERLALVIAAGLVIALGTPHAAAERTAQVTIHPTRVVGKVNPLVFGNNQIDYLEGEEYSHRGSGTWDPELRQPVPEYVALARQAGIMVNRWPGGCAAHHYNWKLTVGPLEQRPNAPFGLPEFLAFCEATDAIPLLTLAVFWGSEADAADLVEYLNAPNDGSNPNGGTDWAALRAGDGHPAPYGVVYFEYGNEDYHGDHSSPGDAGNTTRTITAEEYAASYLHYQAAMKALDPHIQLGGLLQNGMGDWNRKVLAGCGAQMDFAIEHTYTPGQGSEIGADQRRDIQQACLAADARFQDIYDELLGVIEEVTGRTDLPLAITEYNGWFVQENPVPYRQALCNALRNAEHLRIMLRPRNQILMANFWQFANEYWGMVRGYVHAGQTPVKQANYFVYQLYHEHFGDTLVEADVDCQTWNFAGGGWLPPRRGQPSQFHLDEANLLPADYVWDPRYPPAEVHQQIDGDTVCAEFAGPDVNYYAPRVVVPAEAGYAYRVTALIRSEGLTGTRPAQIQVGDARGWVVTQSCTLGGDVLGDQEWTPVVVDYTTLPDTREIAILARRLEGSPVTGTVWYRLVSVQRFTPRSTGAVPDLGVNAARREDGTLTLMVVNRNLDEPVTARLVVAARLGVDGPSAEARAWLLSGPSPEANNLSNPDTVTVSEVPLTQTPEGWTLTLPACSLAAVEIRP